jgi:Xaa-Pro aminopeptidase
MVRENLDKLREFLSREGLYPATAQWAYQQSSTTYGRAWRLEYDRELPEALNRHIGSSGFLGNTNAEALERSVALIHIADAIRETRHDTELRTLEKFAELGAPSAVIALQFVRDGMTFDEAYAAINALGVSA